MQELINAVRELTGKEGILPRLVAAVQCSNVLAKGNARHLRWVLGGLILCTLLLAGESIVLYTTVQQLEENRRLTTEALSKLDTTNEKVEDVQEKQEAAKQVEAAKPTVELVAETDPEKAKKAPIKVRITPPDPSASAPATTAVPTKTTGSHPKSPPLPTVELSLPVPDASVAK